MRNVAVKVSREIQNTYFMYSNLRPKIVQYMR